MSESSTPEIVVEELAVKRKSGFLVDVREPEEYVAGHVPGAVPIPMSQLATRMGEIDKTSPVFFICASGNRSSALTDLLRRAGFDAVYVAAAPAPGPARAAPMKQDWHDHDRPEDHPH